MATQIFGRNHAVLLPRAADAAPRENADGEFEEPKGGAFRGFVFAMLFNLVLALAVLAAWQLWHLL